MRALLMLLALLVGGAVADDRYACLGYSFSLPLEFTAAERDPQQGYTLSYPDDEDTQYRIVFDRLTAGDTSVSQAEFFNQAYKKHVSRHPWSLTGRSRKILGRTVSEAGGRVEFGQSEGRALAWMIPTPSGDRLFLAVLGLRDVNPTQLEGIANVLTSSLKQD